MTTRAGWLSSLFLVSWAASCAPGRALVVDGQSHGEIVISATAGPDERLAANELQAYVRKISRAELPIRTAATRNVASVRIGLIGGDAVEGWSGAIPSGAGFTIDSAGQILRIVGANGSGVLNGVYDYLESDLGVRWYMPGDMGEDVPSRADVLLPRESRTRAPSFAAIGGFIWAGGPGANAWERRVRARVGPVSAFFGHAWRNIIPPTPANKARNPERFALSGGVRTDQLCSAHPDVVRITIEKPSRFSKRIPGPRSTRSVPTTATGSARTDAARPSTASTRAEISAIGSSTMPMPFWRNWRRYTLGKGWGFSPTSNIRRPR